MLRAGLVGGAVALAALAGARSARAAMPADLSGVWQYDRDRPPSRTLPKMTPAAAALVARKTAARQTGWVREVQNLKCLPTGMPLLMQWISPIYIFQDYRRVAILTEDDPGNDQPRTIYLDKKIHPTADTLFPSWNGHSIGHWEGPVLVVDTVGFNERSHLFQGVPRTPKTHIVERFHVSTDGQTLIDTMTMDDPDVLAGPWTVDLTFKRQPADTERLEAVCEPDLGALQALDWNAIKDVDEEAARIADPAQRYNPGGK
ncbi:MAG: hypothetical protein JWO72_680 [Caulobacteraceae bacterium]|nr:hypothetical protein [Caulobacteraceae bacterium]